MGRLPRIVLMILAAEKILENKKKYFNDENIFKFPFGCNNLGTIRKRFPNLGFKSLNLKATWFTLHLICQLFCNCMQV